MLLGVTTMLFAQDSGRPERGKFREFNPDEFIKMNAERMSAKLGLDDKTAAKFQTVYTEYCNELRSLRPGPKKGEGEKADRKEHKMPKVLSDSEIDAQIKEGFANQKKMIELKEKYYSKFRSFLSARQAKRALKVDNGFKRPGRFKAPGKGRFFGPGMNHPGGPRPDAGLQRQ